MPAPVHEIVGRRAWSAVHGHCRRRRARWRATAIGSLDHAFAHQTQSMPILVLGALGVVYGDIGTSPIYAFREALHAASSGEAAVAPEMLGVLSLIVWALTIIVTIKYVVFVLRADNKGEGGTLSLMALARAQLSDALCAPILVIGICGAALFFGDAIITPAISVLSAVEGLKVVTPAFDPYRGADHARSSWPCSLPSSASAPAAWRASSDRSRWSGSWRSASPASRHIADDPTVLLRGQPLLRGGLSVRAARRRLRHHRRGVPRRDRRGGALCRPRPFRPQADRARLAGARVPVPAAQLFRAGRLRALAWRHAAQPVLRDAAGLGAAADGRARDGRDRHRQPGGDLRRLFADAAGRAAQPSAALRDPAHVGDAVRARSTCRASTCCWRSASCCWSSASANPAACLGLRHLGHRRDAGDHDPALRRHAASLEMAACGGGRADRWSSPSSTPASSSPMPPRSPTAAGCRSASPA